MPRIQAGLLPWFLCSSMLVGGCAPQPAKHHQNQEALSGAHAQQATLQNLSMLYQTGRAHQQAGDFSEAIQTYAKLLTIDPTFVEAHNGLGVVYAQMGDHELAVRHLTTAVGLAPLATHLHNNLGYAHLLQGNLADAEYALQQSLQIDPENAQARANLMTVRQRMRATGE